MNKIIAVVVLLLTVVFCANFAKACEAEGAFYMSMLEAKKSVDLDQLVATIDKRVEQFVSGTQWHKASELLRLVNVVEDDIEKASNMSNSYLVTIAVEEIYRQRIEKLDNQVERVKKAASRENHSEASYKKYIEASVKADNNRIALATVTLAAIKHTRGILQKDAKEEDRYKSTIEDKYKELL